MREVVPVLFGIALALVWAAIWTGLLHVLGIAPVSRKVEDQTSTRERLKRVDARPRFRLGCENLLDGRLTHRQLRPR